MTALPAPRRPRRQAVRAPAADQPVLVVVTGRGRGRLLLTVASLLVLVGAVFAAVTLNAVAADDAVVVAELEERLRHAEQVHGALVTEVARLESPARIEEAAAAMGLVKVDHPRQLRVTRVLPADGVVHARDADVLATPFARD